MVTVESRISFSERPTRSDLALIGANRQPTNAQLTRTISSFDVERVPNSYRSIGLFHLRCRRCGRAATGWRR